MKIKMPSHEEMNPIKLNNRPDKWTDKERVFAALNLIYILDLMGGTDVDNEELIANGVKPEIIQMGKMTGRQVKEARDIALEAVKKEREEAVLDIERPVHNGMIH